MNKDKIQIRKKSNLRGENGSQVLSIRIKDETVSELDKISLESNHSRNKIINIFLEYALSNYEII